MTKRPVEFGDLIQPTRTWADLTLPEAQTDPLRQIAAQLRQRAKLAEELGFGEKLQGGVTLLFSGPSGTGKTMAAEALANDLSTLLYRIDLSAVVNKYIGETEKNLNRIFAAAEASKCVLFFDEADALFGKRTEVKDAHDRYANPEVSYLLQKLETYDGLAILASNLASNRRNFRALPG